MATSSRTISGGSSLSASTSKPRPPPTPKLPKPGVGLPNYNWRAPCPSTSGGHTTPRELYYVTRVAGADNLIRSLQGPLGFDVEWRPTFQKGGATNPIALVQLADEHRVLLLHISLMGRQVPSALKQILEDETQLKIGVGIHGDKDKVLKDLRIHLRGVVELTTFARAVDNGRWGVHNGMISLARLTEAYANLNLAKTKKVQLGNWEARLPQAMQEYAANDAASALTVYNRLHQIRLALPSPPKQSAWIFDISARALAELDSNAAHISIDQTHYESSTTTVVISDGSLASSSTTVVVAQGSTLQLPNSSMISKSKSKSPVSERQSYTSSPQLSSSSELVPDEPYLTSTSHPSHSAAMSTIEHTTSDGTLNIQERMFVDDTPDTISSSREDLQKPVGQDIRGKARREKNRKRRQAEARAEASSAPTGSTRSRGFSVDLGPPTKRSRAVTPILD